MCPHAQMREERTSTTEKIRCVLAHDHVLLRQGLRRLLEDEPDVEVVAEAGSAAAALQNVFEHQPEVVIADMQMFAGTADQAESLILQESPHSKVLFLTLHEDEVAISAAKNTAMAARQTSAEELVEMVRKAYLSGTSAQETPRKTPESWRLDEPVSRKRPLTTREREVLKLLAEGRTVRTTAGLLGLSVKTVEAHKFNLMRKLGIHNKAELVMWAIQKKVVKLPANL